MSPKFKNITYDFYCDFHRSLKYFFIFVNISGGGGYSPLSPPLTTPLMLIIFLFKIGQTKKPTTESHGKYEENDTELQMLSNTTLDGNLIISN